MHLDNLDARYIHDDDRDREPGACLLLAALTILLGACGVVALVLGGAAWLLMH